MHTAPCVRIEGNDLIIGSSYCGSAPNSNSATGASISGSGSTSVGANNFTLVSENAIPNGAGLFFYGPNTDLVPFGDGFRCVGGSIRRFNPGMFSDNMGMAVRPVDFTVPPANAGTHMITPGSIWFFQHWYRDVPAGMSGFNLSNGLAVQFTP